MTKKQKNAQLEKKLSAYAMAGAAALIAPIPANASIVSFLNVNQTVTYPGSYTFNLSGAASADLVIQTESNVFANAIVANAGTSAGVLIDSGSSPAAASALAFGALISPATSNFGTSGKLVSSFSPAPGDWSSTGGSSYLGFYFTGANGKQAGWAQIATTANSTTASFEILGYAYETSAGQSITAGQLSDASVPEPSSMALLALGGAGLLALRRRRSISASTQIGPS